MRERTPLTRVPALDAPDQEIKEFLLRWFNDYTIYRSRQMERMALALFYYIGRQWIERDDEVIADGRGYSFRAIPQPEGQNLPRPVINRIAPTVEVELAALGKSQLMPQVVATSRDPRIRAVAKVAGEILDHRMRVLKWDSIREMATFLTVVCGTGIIRSTWDESYVDTVKVAAPGAVKCASPDCDTTLASRNVPLDLTKGTSDVEPAKHMENARAADEDSVNLQYCPTCGTKTPLLPMEMDEEQASGQDHYGRPLGMAVPKGNTHLEVVSPFDIFPENGGIDVLPWNVKTWGHAAVRSLDWVEEHYPEVCDLVEPDPTADLLKLHPSLGDRTYLGRFHVDQDSGIYENHVRVMELHGDKTYRFPDGRSIVAIGMRDPIIAENGTLYRTVGGASVAKVKFTGAQFKPGRHKEFWGQSLVDDLISPQNRLNGMDAQIVEARDRLGNPNMLFTESMQADGPEYYEEYGGGKIMRWTPDPMNPNLKPEVYSGTTFPTEVYQERDRLLQDMKEIAGPQDIEVGEAPRNISTTSGLQLLGENADKRHAIRERGLIQMFEATWNHQLDLLRVLRTDSDEYTVENADGAWEIEQFDRDAIGSMNKVICEKQAFIDKSIYQKEATREALADGLYRLDSQAAVKRILELMNLPTDVNEDLNRQVDVAKEQWTAFIDKGEIPIVDMDIDEPRIRYQTLATFLTEDEGLQVEKEVGWREVVPKIAGWEEELTMAEQMDMQAKAFYGTSDPMAAQQMYGQAQQMFAQQQESAQQAAEAAEQEVANTGIPAMPVTPPQPPPPPIFLPAYKPDRIYGVWKQLLQRADMQAAMQDPNFAAMVQQSQQMGAPPPPPPQAQQNPALDMFMRFRSVVAAYKRLAEEKEARMMAGMPTVAAPGTPEGNPGVGGAQPGMQAPNMNPPTQPNNPPNVPGGKDKNQSQAFKQR